MRLFIAIDIDEETRKGLGDLQQQLQSKADIKKSDVKWVRPENIHLTLKFLGEVKDEKVADVCRIVKEVSGRHKNFEVDVKTVGHFGGRAARILWVGAGEGNEQLQQLQKDIDRQLSEAGWPKETRRFAGHLTLCRIRNPAAGIKLAQVSEDYKEFKIGTIAADSVVVYQSELTPQGPIYAVLDNCKLLDSG